MMRLKMRQEKKPKEQAVFNPENHSGYGDIYFYDTHNLNNVFIDCINKHIPLIIIKCYMECGICKSFRKNILENPSFVNWLKNDFGKCSIMYCNDGGGRYRLPPSMPPNGKNIEFMYKTKNNESKLYNTQKNNWIDFGNYTNNIRLKNSLCFLKIKINTVDGKIFLYQVKDEFKKKYTRNLGFFKHVIL